MPARKLPPDSQLLAWLSEGKTHKQIQAIVQATTGHEVSESTISVAVSRLGAANRRKNHVKYIPWRVQAAHIRQYPAIMLRVYARYMDADRDASILSHDDRRRLFGWLAMLAEDHKVVDYKPDDGGFVYVRARQGEETIREPKPNSPLRRAATA